MTVTVHLLQEWFAQFNAQYFGGKLPPLPIRLSKARTRLGTMQCVTRRGTLLHKGTRTFSISISTYYDCSERDFQTVLLHEMIHYYISYNKLRDTSPHGVLFRKMMDSINSRGWHITVSTNTKGWTVNECQKRRGKHLLLVVETSHGERFISSVCIGSAFKIHRAIGTAGRQITHENWYVSSDPLFDDMGKVRTLRGHKINTEADMERYLAVMKHVDTQELFSGHYCL